MKRVKICMFDSSFNINSLIPYILASLKEEIRQSIVGIWETSSHQHHIE
jgi:hypothetical protein